LLIINSEALQATQPIEGLNSEQPQEEPPQVSIEDEEDPEVSADPDDASISSGEDSEEEVQRMAEADGREITEILTIFTKHLKVVEANTEKLAEHARSLNETVVKIAINSRKMHEKLAAVEASTTEMQTSMAAMEERNRLHEIGTHSIRFHTQNMGMYLKTAR
jgi:regulator of replication initiation timing